MKLIERKFKEKIWYIGYDLTKDKPTENFILDKGGNLKFIFDKKVKIKADLPREKLKNSINFAIQKMLPKGVSVNTLFDININGY